MIQILVGYKKTGGLVQWIDDFLRKDDGDRQKGKDGPEGPSLWAC